MFNICNNGSLVPFFLKKSVENQTQEQGSPDFMPLNFFIWDYLLLNWYTGSVVIVMFAIFDNTATTLVYQLGFYDFVFTVPGLLRNSFLPN